MVVPPDDNDPKKHHCFSGAVASFKVYNNRSGKSNGESKKMSYFPCILLLRRA